MAAQAALPYDTLVNALRYWHRHDSTRPAFVFRDRHGGRSELSYGQVYELGGRWAAMLHEDGVRQQTLVANTLPNSPERVLCEVGIVMAGAVSVNAQCQLADGSDLLFTLRQSEAYAVCLNPDQDWGPWSVLRQHVRLDPLNNAVTSDSLPALKKVYFIKRTTQLGSNVNYGTESDATKQAQATNENKLQQTFTAERAVTDMHGFISGLHTSSKFYTAELSPDAMATVFTTSGSTGFSKLVPATHASLLTYCSLLSDGGKGFSLSFSCSPLGWAGGYVFVHLAIGKGRALLDTWDGLPDNMALFVWDMIVKEKCSVGILMPYLIHQIVECEDRKHWKMKSLIVTGQPLTKETVSKAFVLSESVVTSYGATELMVVTDEVLSNSDDYKDHKVGRPLSCNTVKVCNPDGEEVTRGTKGEIYVKTPCMANGYLNNKEITKASFTQDGFFRTGDIGVMQEDGSLLVQGRHHDAIHKGNYIFYPAWLESRIAHCCPGLREVLVVGVPDPGMGQEICACFVASDPSLSEEHVRRQVEKDILVGTEDPLSPLPRYYVSFQNFPRTFTGKPLRRGVQEEAARRLKLG